MPLCAPACAVKPPKIPKDCGVNIRPGGIRHIVFAPCSLRFKNIYNLNEWAEYVLKGDIVISSPLVGQKAKGSFTKKRVNSCQPEVVIGIERSITFMDHNADLLEYSDFNFYNQIQANPNLYQFGFITCNNEFYGFIDTFSIEVDLVIEDNNNGNSFWDGTISWQGFDMPTPLNIPGLVNVLMGGYAELPNFHPCEVATSSLLPAPNYGSGGSFGNSLTGAYFTVLNPVSNAYPSGAPGQSVHYFLTSWQGLNISTQYIFGANYQWYFFPGTSNTSSYLVQFWQSIGDAMLGDADVSAVESVPGIVVLEGQTEPSINVNQMGVYAVKIEIPGCAKRLLAFRTLPLAATYSNDIQNVFNIRITPTTLTFSDTNNDGYYNLAINETSLNEPLLPYSGNYQYAVIVNGVQSLWQNAPLFTGLPQGLAGTLIIRQISYPYASRSVDFIVG